MPTLSTPAERAMIFEIAGVVVVVETEDGAEAVAQGRRDHRVARRGADQRELRHRQADAAGAGALADHDVEREVLHRRVEHLLDGAREAVDLVDEQHVAGLEVRQNGVEVEGAVDGRAGGDAHLHAHLVGEDAASVVLPRPGGP